MSTSNILYTPFQIPKRFYSLDVIRGLAALSVVFWHWQHFFYNGTAAINFNKTLQPFYSILFIFYDAGLIAVQFFFSLSGFIFFWLYHNNISEGKITAWKFSVLRFSRLYPLHFLTLIFVLFCQSSINYHSGYFIVYSYNDLYHFMLNIFLISNWGFEQGFSYNGPIWSVSIEIMLYIIFFILCRLINTTYYVLLFVITAGLALSIFCPIIGQGIFCFFLGGLIFKFYSGITKSGKIIKVSMPLLIVTLMGWLLVVLEDKYHLLFPILASFIGNICTYHNHNYCADIIHRLFKLFIMGFLFPITILILAIFETIKGSLGRRLSFIGNISYSLYLIHFPLQLLIIIIVDMLAINKLIFYTKSSMLLFIAILISLSLLSYYKFERPMQSYLRNRLITR